MRIIIFGCGRTGSTLALQLSSRGADVTIIEANPASLRRLGNDHGCNIVIGGGTDDDILMRAGIRECDAFFALTRGDNTNLMAAQIARLRFKCPKVCVKVADPLRAEAYRKLGYVCVNPSALTAGYMRDWITETEFERIDTYNALTKELKI